MYKWRKKWDNGIQPSPKLWTKHLQPSSARTRPELICDNGTWNPYHPGPKSMQKHGFLSGVLLHYMQINAYHASPASTVNIFCFLNPFFIIFSLRKTTRSFTSLVFPQPPVACCRRWPWRLRQSYVALGTWMMYTPPWHMDMYIYIYYVEYGRLLSHTCKSMLQNCMLKINKNDFVSQI